MSTSVGPDAVREPAPPPRDEGRSLGSRLGGVAAHLDRLHDAGRRGPLAELRRLSLREIPGETFWAIVERFDIGREDEGFWMEVLPLMVRHPHQRGMKPGRALAAARISKARFERWLRLDRAGARREAGRLLSSLKDGGLDWVELGYTLHRWNEEDRYALARDFFLARGHQEHTSTTGAD